MAILTCDTLQRIRRGTAAVDLKRWPATLVDKMAFGMRRNPSPFPDRIWLRHSALLDAARHHTRG